MLCLLRLDSEFELDPEPIPAAHIIRKPAVSTMHVSCNAFRTHMHGSEDV